jgi:beta-lactamase regulating signal transducer with metallopeptidase domain
VTGLFTWLWQGMALTGAVALLMRGSRRLNAATRHIMWWTALWAVILLPLLSQLLAVWRNGRTGWPISAPDTWVLPTVPNWLLVVAGVLWACRVAHRLLHVARSAILVRRLKEQSWPLGADHEARLRIWTTIRQSGRRSSLHLFAGAGGACALGFARPVILVSDALASKLSDEELDQIVIHEQAHLARYDDWGRLVQALLGAVFDLHPAVRFITGQIDLEREAACDDHVVACTGRTREFARCLVEVAAATRVSFATTMISGATNGATELRRRVRRLLERHRNHEPRVFRVASGAAMVSLGIAIGLFSLLPPVVGFRSRSDAGTAVRPSTEKLAERVAPPFESQRPIVSVTPVAGAMRHSSTDKARVTARNAAVRRNTTARRVGPVETAPSDQDSLISVPIGRAVDSFRSTTPEEVPSRVLAQQVTVGTMPHAERRDVMRASPSERRPWDKLAESGTTLGGTAQSAGVSLGRFLTNRAKTLAEKF